MGKYCENCGKFMKDPLVTHCSDECLLFILRNSQSLNDNEPNALFWDERSDPWT